jgi:hypothetical protein
MSTIKEGGSFETFNDPRGNPLTSINRDGTISTLGIDFADGTKQTTAATGGGSSNVRATGNIMYTVTATDVSRGYATFPFTFSTPFADANYAVSGSDTGLNSGVDSVVAGYMFAGSVSKTASGFTAVVTYTALGTQMNIDDVIEFDIVAVHN